MIMPSSKKPKTKRSGASRRVKKTEKQQPSLLEKFIALFLVVGFAGGLYWLTQQPAATKPQTTTSDTAENNTPSASNSDIKFEFYDTLPKAKVDVDVQIARANKDNKDVIYTLQVASFRTAKDADQLRAYLTLNGMTAKVVNSTSKGEVWHKVIIGPYTQRSKVDSVKKKLLEQGMDPLIRRRMNEEQG